MEEFSISDVMIYTGVPAPIVELWIKNGRVKPSIHNGLETGKPHLFSREDLYHIAFLKKIKESGFSSAVAIEKINVYAICKSADDACDGEPIAIAFSRVLDRGDVKAQGAWIIGSALDRQTGWDSMDLLSKRLNEGADDFYLLNFTKLKQTIDTLVEQARG